MQTRIIAIDEPGAYGTAQKLLDAGELVAFPTDTVYGLAASIHHPEAIDALFQVKGREFEKAIPILIGSKEDIANIAINLNSTTKILMDAFWPGAITLVLTRYPGLPINLSPVISEPDQATIAVRMPDHPAALELLRQAGPLAVTSANLSGAESTNTAAEVMAQLSNRIPLILDGGMTPGGIASTVVDCTGPEVIILRAGPISEHEIKSVLG